MSNKKPCVRDWLVLAYMLVKAMAGPKNRAVARTALKLYDKMDAIELKIGPTFETKLRNATKDPMILALISAENPTVCDSSAA